MALAFDATSSGGGGSSSSHSYSHTTSGDDRILVVAVGMDDEGSSVSSIKYNSVDLTLAKRQATASKGAVELWYLVAPATGSNTVAVTMTTSDYHGSATISLTGADQSSPIDATAGQALENQDSWTTSITTVTDDAMIVDGAFNWSASATAATTETDQTERADLAVTFGRLYASTRLVTTAGSYDMGWDIAGSTSDDVVHALVAIKPGDLTIQTQAISATATFYNPTIVSNQHYTWESVVALPSDDTDLANTFSASDYDDVDTDNNVYVASGDQSGFVVFQFKDKNSNNTDEIEPTCILKCATAPSTSTAYLQIYNRNSASWETLDSDSATGADTEFTLTGSQTTNLSNYYDANFVVSCRVYQEAA